ncbi:MAG: glutathione S-transferase [Rickettsiales bacterium]|nr:MAG: glutathione S-transferase [Rickettsiales bacterium]
MKDNILYSFRRCPYAMRSRMILNYSKFNCIIREVDLKNKPQELLNISPKGTVPVLQLTDERILEQSLDIMKHVLSIHDPENILDVNQTQNIEIQSFIIKNDNTFAPLLRNYKYPEKFNVNQNNSRDIIEKEFLEQYELQLEDNEFLLGKLSLADYAVLPFIRQFAYVDQEWFFNSKYKNIITWLNYFIDDDEFESIVMSKMDVWNPEQKPKYFLKMH